MMVVRRNRRRSGRSDQGLILQRGVQRYKRWVSRRKGVTIHSESTGNEMYQAHIISACKKATNPKNPFPCICNKLRKGGGVKSEWSSNCRGGIWRIYSKALLKNTVPMQREVNHIFRRARSAGSKRNSFGGGS